MREVEYIATYVQVFMRTFILYLHFIFSVHMLNRFCFVEMAHNNGQLLDVEYVVLCKWYDWIEQNFDIHLDLIGKWYDKLMATFISLLWIL